jgi:hypothetical protein
LDGDCIGPEKIPPNIVVAFTIFTTMRIQEQALNHWIDNFYGYGSWSAPIWFVDYEEGGGDTPEEVAEKLNYFYSKHSSNLQPKLCDIRELYKHVAFRIDGPRADLFTNLYQYRFGKNATQHGSWKNLIAFAHSFQNRKLPNLLNYQKNAFAQSSGNNEALLRLYPLPAHNHAWYYSWLDMPKLEFLKSRAAYEEHVYANRMRIILQNMRLHKPELVMMYGMSNINKLKESVQASFPEVKFKMIKAIKQQIPQHHRTDINGTTLVITTQIPSLRHNRIETGFDWQAFGKSVRS